MEPEVIEEEVSLFAVSENPPPEVTTPAPQEEEAPFEIPKKFEGKSMEDVVTSYVNLEKEFGNKSNEVGELRKLTDQILMNQASQPQRVVEDDYIEDEVGFDDFINDPASAVNKALDSNPRLQKLEESLQARDVEVSRNALRARHKDAEEIVSSPNFQTWVNEEQGRARILQEAHQTLNSGLASDLLDMYKVTRNVATEEAIKERDERAKGDLRKATVEVGSVPARSKKTYRRAELIQLKITDPQRYDAMSDEIKLAYAEKRVK